MRGTFNTSRPNRLIRPGKLKDSRACESFFFYGSLAAPVFTVNQQLLRLFAAILAKYSGMLSLIRFRKLVIVFFHCFQSMHGFGVPAIHPIPAFSSSGTLYQSSSAIQPCRPLFPSMTFRTLSPWFSFVIVHSLFFAFSMALGWTRMNSSAFPLPYALCLL